jgi:hypothetical protein
MMKQKPFYRAIAIACALIATPICLGADLLLVVDTAKSRILACNLDNKEVDPFADLDAFCIVGSPDGCFYASRTLVPTISKLDKEGNVIADWPVPGNQPAFGLVYDNGSVLANIGDAECALARFSTADGKMEASMPWGERSASMRGLCRGDSLVYGASFGNSVVKSMSLSLSEAPSWVEAKSARAVDVLVSDSGERFVSYQGAPSDDPQEKESYPPGVYSDMSQTPIISGFVPFGLAEAKNRLYVSDVGGCIRVFDPSSNFVELDRIELPTGVRPGMLCIVKGKKAP